MPMNVVALKDLKTYGARKGETFATSPLRAKELMRQGLARLPDRPAPAVAAEVGAVPAPLAGSPTGAAEPASSSGPAPARSERRSRKPKAAAES